MLTFIEEVKEGDILFGRFGIYNHKSDMFLNKIDFKENLYSDKNLISLELFLLTSAKSANNSDS